VPADLPDGTRLCDRGFVSGPAGDGFGREKSNDVCFIVRRDQPAQESAPAVTPLPTQTLGSPRDAPLKAPEAELTAPELTPAPAPTPLTATPFASPVAHTAPSPAPILAGPAGQGRPATEIGPESTVADQQQTTLPRTGSPVEGTARLGTLALLLGGIFLLAGRRRAGSRSVASAHHWLVRR
jgi:hypothetical protein